MTIYDKKQLFKKVREEAKKAGFKRYDWQLFIDYDTVGITLIEERKPLHDSRLAEFYL